MIDKRLVGTWWIWKNDEEKYSMYRGDSPPYPSGVLADDAITFWTNTKQNIIIDRKSSKSEFIDLSGITFPPAEYLDSGVTEIEILPNGNYLIYKTISFNDYGKQENLSGTA